MNASRLVDEIKLFLNFIIKMASGGKKRKLGCFELPKDEKILKTIDDLRKEYQFDGFKIEIVDNSPTGSVYCLGACQNKNAEFSARGSRYILNPQQRNLDNNTQQLTIIKSKSTLKGTMI